MIAELLPPLPRSQGIAFLFTGRQHAAFVPWTKAKLMTVEILGDATAGVFRTYPWWLLRPTRTSYSMALVYVTYHSEILKNPSHSRLLS